ASMGARVLINGTRYKPLVGSNPTPSARPFIRRPSPSFANGHKYPFSTGISDASCLCTRSPPFAIVRYMSAGIRAGFIEHDEDVKYRRRADGKNDRTADGTQRAVSEGREAAARHVLRRQRVVPAENGRRGIVDLSLQAE